LGIFGIKMPAFSTGKVHLFWIGEKKIKRSPPPPVLTPLVMKLRYEIHVSQNTCIWPASLSPFVPWLTKGISSYSYFIHSNDTVGTGGYINFSPCGALTRSWVMASPYRASRSHWLNTTVGRTSLDEWSARRRELYLPIHTTYKRQTSMLTAGFEPEIPSSHRPQIHVLDRAVTGIDGYRIFNIGYEN